MNKQIFLFIFSSDIFTLSITLFIVYNIYFLIFETLLFIDFILKLLICIFKETIKRYNIMKKLMLLYFNYQLFSNFNTIYATFSYKKKLLL